MPTDGALDPDRSSASDDALGTAMAELGNERAPLPGESAERYWLRLGIDLALRQPGRAALLLAGLEAGAVPAAAAPMGRGDDAVGEDAAAEVDDDSPVDPSAVPVRSMLLTRSAELPASADAETRFGWVSQLTPTEIRRLGHEVTERLANGARRDLERGFGLAWSAGANLPREDLRRMFGRFAELELAVSGVLGGRDLLSMPQAPESGVSALLSVFLPKTNAASSEAASILEREGDPARRGLVAIWNAWAASRYRDRIAPELFDELVGPWVAVIGPVPGP